MKVMGIDLSLTSTGIAYVEDGALADTWRVRSAGSKKANLADRQYRLDRIRSEVFEVASAVGHDLFVVEAPSFGSSTGSQHDRSGLWWLVVDMLLDIGRGRVATVPPTTRALYATGKGNADKRAVFEAITANVPGKAAAEVAALGWRQGNDMADAMVLAAMGASHLGEPIQNTIPHDRMDEALRGVEWPV